MNSPPLRRLYPRLTSFASLHAAAHRARLGKRYRPAVLAFHSNLEAELLRLQDELRSFTCRPGPYRQFRIRDPKPRLISAAPFRDRVVHHALCAAIVPPLERAFHPGSHANRRGYGSHRALRRFAVAAARHRWVLQADIRLYFPSLDLTILRRQLADLIACPGTLWLLDQILANGASQGAALDAFPGDTLLTPWNAPGACRSATSPASSWPIFTSTPSTTPWPRCLASACTCAMWMTWPFSRTIPNPWPWHGPAWRAN